MNFTSFNNTKEIAMKTTIQSMLTNAIFVLFSVVLLQSCATQENTSDIQKETAAVQPSETNTSTAQITQEEVEQAAALLILAAAMSETDQADYTNDYSSEDNYTEDERKSAMIHDVVETNLADNIVYE